MVGLLSQVLTDIMQVISSRYAAKGAIEGLDQEVEFTSDRITLDLPADGITVKEGWSIRPLIHPTVSNSLCVWYTAFMLSPDNSSVCLELWAIIAGLTNTGIKGVK